MRVGDWLIENWECHALERGPEARGIPDRVIRPERRVWLLSGRYLGGKRRFERSGVEAVFGAPLAMPCAGFCLAGEFAWYFSSEPSFPRRQLLATLRAWASLQAEAQRLEGILLEEVL